MDLSNSKSRQVQIDPEEILQKVDLAGTTDWDPAEQWEAHNLICEYTCIFSQNNIDLCKTSVVKHSIKQTNSTPFKEHYWNIPPGMYKEVKTHIQEMIDIVVIYLIACGQLLWF